MTALVVVDEAEQQLREIVTWWREHRPAAASLVLHEFEGCVRLLRASPDVGLRFRTTTVPGVRRVLMPRSRHHLYYVHDATNAVVYVIAVWGAAKDAVPPLRPPSR